MPRLLRVSLGAAAASLCLTAALAAQGGFHRRWEIPGFDYHPDGGWRPHARRVAQWRRQLLERGDFATLNAPAQGRLPVPRGPAPAVSGVAAFAGTIRVPMVLFSYQGVDAAYMRDTSQYRALLFDVAPPAPSPYSLRSYYAQLSNALLDMQGQAIGWAVLAGVESTYTGAPGTCTGNPFGTGDCNGIFGNNLTRLQNGLREALATVDGAVDFAQFDSDGDGFVDMLGFAHATRDGACGPPPGSSSNNHVWAHRFVLLSPYVTNDPSPGGGTVAIRDYFVQSALGGATACDSTQIMPIGTAAHEFGHALGLPDLYDTSFQSEGVGQWGLMGSGNWATPRSPSRMEAWSLSRLGWVTIRLLDAPGTYTLGAAPTADTAFLVRVPAANPRGEYYLVENRQRVLADSAVIRVHCARSGNPPGCGGGLLAWHIDSARVADGALFNSVNTGSIHGVALEEADGLDHLDDPAAPPTNRRGDAGDPYPGVTGNTALSVGTNPAAVTNADGSFAGFALDSIRPTAVANEMAFRLRFGGVMLVRASDSAAVVIVAADTVNVFRDLLDDGVTISVAVPDTQLATDGRTRWRFVAWSDSLPRTHDVMGSLAGDTVIATLARDFRVVVTVQGAGTVTPTPAIGLGGAFVAESTTVSLAAQAGAGYVFGAWTGDTATGSATLALPMRRPYTLTARFDSLLAITSVATRPAAVMGATHADTLRVTGGSGTATWSVVSGALPPGLALAAATGRIAGVPAATGSFAFTAQVVSGPQTLSRQFTVVVGAPALATSAVVSHLLNGAGALTADELRYLDLLGNGNGFFDVGDFRAWVDATGAPLTAPAAALVGGRR